MASFAQTGLAQSFQQTAGNIAGAGILMSVATPSWPGLTDTVTISLYNALPNAGGTMLVSGTGTATAGTLFDVTFNTVVSVAPATTMYLVFTSVANSMAIDGAAGNPYAFGQVYANNGFQPFPTFDYTFRTYSSGSVPAPGSLALLALGLVGMIALRRRNAAV